MSDDEAAFIRAICLRPEEDAPRLIYADWLDENASQMVCPTCEGHWTNIPMKRTGCATCKGTGNIKDDRGERATFIRMQVKHANGSEPHVVQRRGRILQLCERPVWTDMLKRVSYPTVLRIENTGMSWVEFRRGFPCAIKCPLGDLKSNYVRLFEEHPIQRIELPLRYQGSAIRWLQHLGSTFQWNVRYGETETISKAFVGEFRKRAGLESQ